MRDCGGQNIQQPKGKVRASILSLVLHYFDSVLELCICTVMFGISLLFLYNKYPLKNL